MPATVAVAETAWGQGGLVVEVDGDGLSASDGASARQHADLAESWDRAVRDTEAALNSGRGNMVSWPALALRLRSISRPALAAVPVCPLRAGVLVVGTAQPPPSAAETWREDGRPQRTV